VYCLTSDGEWQEGSTWEALIFLCHHRLSNLTVLVDHNRLQGFGSTREVASMDPLHARLAGFDVELREPDGQDPLGGVVDVRGPFGLVQIVNFGGRFPAVIENGIAAADTVIRPGSRLRIVPLPQLVALKLYAGGTKSHADIVELLSRNPDADRAAIRDLCRTWRLRGLDPLIEEAAGEP
jgi:hypothetical protein